MGIATIGINRREDVFGQDVNTFRPERWLRGHAEASSVKDESEEIFNDRRAKMERCDMQFGYGPRACIGKNITALEVDKVVGTVFGLFQVRQSTLPISK